MDFAGDMEDRKSTGGYTMFVGEGAISWSSKKQSIVALLSTEAEYIVLSETACEILWVWWFLEGVDIIFNGPITIYKDNQSMITLTQN
jgi:hypothetical protein